MNLSELDSLYAKGTPGTWVADWSLDWAQPIKADGDPFRHWHVSSLWEQAEAEANGSMASAASPASRLAVAEFGMSREIAPEVDANRALIVALHNSYPALRDRLRALEDALEPFISTVAKIPGVTALDLVDYMEHRDWDALFENVKRLAALDKEATADWMNPLDSPDLVSLIDPDLDLPD